MMLLDIAFEVVMEEGNFESFFLMITKRLDAVFHATTMSAGPRALLDT